MGGGVFSFFLSFFSPSPFFPPKYRPTFLSHLGTDRSREASDHRWERGTSHQQEGVPSPHGPPCRQSTPLRARLRKWLLRAHSGTAARWLGRRALESSVFVPLNIYSCKPECPRMIPLPRSCRRDPEEEEEKKKSNCPEERRTGPEMT